MRIDSSEHAVIKVVVDKFAPMGSESSDVQLNDSAEFSNPPIRVLSEPSRQSFQQLSNSEEYLPTFGPLYTVKPEVMDHIKENAWEHVIRNTHGSRGRIMEVYSAAMKQVEEQAINMYDCNEIVKVSEFRWMMIKDGCLCNQLVLHILGCSKQLGYTHDHPIFGRVDKNRENKKWIEALFYPGNQLPIVVLRVLMDQPFFQNVIAITKWNPIQFGLCKKLLYEQLILPSLTRTHRFSLINRIGTMFWGGCSSYVVEQRCDMPSDILDGFRDILIGPDEHPTSEDETDSDTSSEDDDDEDEIWYFVDGFNNIRIFPFLPSATVLKQAGIHIKVLKSGGTKAIHYKNYYFWAYIYLPPLVLDNNTEFLFQKLKYYESFQYRKRLEVSLYLKVMRDLICTPRDAKLLQNNGVIHGKSDYIEKLPDMFRRLSSKRKIRLSPGVRILRSQIRHHYSPCPGCLNCLSVFVFIGMVLALISAFFRVMIYIKK